MLADRTPNNRPAGIACSIATLLRSLPTAEKTALQDMLANPAEWSQNALHEALTDEGYKVGRQTIGRHRRGHRRCGTPTTNGDPT